MNTIQADMTGFPIERMRGRFGEILDAAPTRPAAIGRRVAAYVLDVVICMVGLLATGLIGSLVGGAIGAASDTAATIAFLILIAGLIAIPIAYFVVVEAKTGGTPGKHMLGLLVLRSDGGDIGYREAILRNLLRIVDAFPMLYLVGFISIAASDRNQRLGDRVADTVVVQR